MVEELNLLRSGGSFLEFHLSKECIGRVYKLLINQLIEQETCPGHLVVREAGDCVSLGILTNIRLDEH